MSTLDQLKALCAAREKATKGEWERDGQHINCNLRWSGDFVISLFDDAMDEDGDFIVAAANLDYPRLIAMVERYEAALRFYANQKNYSSGYVDHQRSINFIEYDDGEKAREALAKKETP